MAPSPLTAGADSRTNEVMMSRSLMISVLALVVIACEQPVAAPDLAPEPARLSATDADASPFSSMRRQGDFDYVFYEDEPMVPAYGRRGPLASGKADWATDVRAAAPERYAITDPPEGAFRPMIEWEPMASVVMSYPGDMSSYDGITNTAVQIGLHAATVAEVWYIVDSQSASNLLYQSLQSAGLSASLLQNKVRFMVQPIDSIWFIDSGPLPLVRAADGTQAFADFRYYYDRPYDDGISTWLGRLMPSLGFDDPADTYRMPINTEGGTFQSTSGGVCFTGTRQLYNMSCEAGFCDPSLDDWPFADEAPKTTQQYLTALQQIQTSSYAKEIKDVWAEYAGCKDVIITYSITDDGTGHIDMYLKVIDDNTVMLGDYATPSAVGDQYMNAKRMDATALFLEDYVKPDGDGFEVPRLLMPGHKNTNSGAIPFTYINSTFINGLNLWPATTYSDWSWSRDAAQATWEAVMPDHEHIWIDSTEISFWSGAVHCITRTIPDLPTGPWIADGSCSNGTCQAPAGGYDSVCTPGESADPVCYGPAWQCACNDCSGSCPLPGEDACNGISYTGCCDGSQLQYCDGGELQFVGCQSCGWDGTNGWYDCGQSGSDPTGENPKSCDDITGSCTPSCGGKECGPDGCAGSCGSCVAGEACSAQGQCEAAICTPICGGKECGGDGCGGLCGECAADQTCSSGSCISKPDTGCGDVSWEGLCDDGYMAYCDGLSGELVELNCDTGCCGWYPSEGYYWCYTEENCTDFCVHECELGEQGCSVQGTHAWTCIEPPGAQCRVREWSSCTSGCDEVTGICDGVACEPSCQGKECGDDGCGGDCGTCGSGTQCEAGQCADLTCVPVCDGKVCGADGCGSQCGSCVVGQSCNDKGQCIDDGCQPACDGKVCGDNGCGGVCGQCDAGDLCESGLCVPAPCTPDCDGKTCGDDGCDGVCGTCDSGSLCTESGICEKIEGCGEITYDGHCEGDVVIWCEDSTVQSYDCTSQGKVCGEKPGVGSTCIEGETCAPACGGRTCGPDGCGGSCGTCPSGSDCEQGTCVEDEDPTTPDPTPDATSDPTPDPTPDPTDPGIGTGDDPISADDPSLQDAQGESSSGCSTAGSSSSPLWLWVLALAWPLRRRQ